MLNDKQLERYSRNISVKEIGLEGQQKLLESKVLVVGAGGLGSPAILYLAAAGVGTIGIVDSDIVDLSNLQRQIIHSNVGEDKVTSSKERVNKLNPDVKVITYKMRLDETNASDIFKEYDFIIDATDTYESKMVINDAAVKAEKPFVHAGVLRFEGQVMTYVPHKSPDYRCIMPDKPNDAPNAKSDGIIGAVAGVIGSIEAMEAIKYLLGIGDLLTGNLLTYNALTNSFHIINLDSK